MNMNRLLVAGACALFLVACTKPESPPTPTGNPPATAAQTDAKTVLELGREI